MATVLIRSQDRHVGDINSGTINLYQVIEAGDYLLDHFVMENSIKNIPYDTTFTGYVGDVPGVDTFVVEFPSGHYTPTEVETMISDAITAKGNVPGSLSFSDPEFKFNYVSTDDWGWVITGDSGDELTGILGLESSVQFGAGDVKGEVSKFITTPYIQLFIEDMQSIQSSTALANPTLIINSPAEYHGVIRFEDEILLTVKETKYIRYNIKDPDGALVALDHDWILVLKSV